MNRKRRGDVEFDFIVKLIIVLAVLAILLFIIGLASDRSFAILEKIKAIWG